MRTLAILAVATVLTGCIHVDSDDIERTPTTGQQLIDLAEAHEKGLISDSEYKEERRKILDDD